MISVLEVWHLKPELAAQAIELMQRMDDMVGPPAHLHPGWCGHAQFFQSQSDPATVLMLYPWRSRELHDDLTAREEPALADFYQRFCTRPREINYYTPLPVDVDGEDHHPELHAPGAPPPGRAPEEAAAETTGESG
jgi:hypothetical protein